MYRDGATSLDEHDRAVGAILISEELLASCERAARQVQDPDAQECWRAAADIHDYYPEIWRHLDRAKRVLANRGINTAGYDELRPHVKTSVPTHREDGSHAIDATAFDDARRALEELRLAVPGADWDAIEQRTKGLVGGQLLRRRGQQRRQRLVVAGVFAVLGIAVATWGFAIKPVHKPSHGETLHKELREIVEHRRERIAELRTTLGNSCDPAQAHELVKLLAMDGDDAAGFGDRYINGCGDDDFIERWAHAPRP